MDICKNCKGYVEGLDGKPGHCSTLIVADTWNGYDSLEFNGIGYSDEQYDKECSVLYVGENFGCNRFKSK